jgi:hypothetical protein
MRSNKKGSFRLSLDGAMVRQRRNVKALSKATEPLKTKTTFHLQLFSLRLQALDYK